MEPASDRVSKWTRFSFFFDFENFRRVNLFRMLKKHDPVSLSGFRPVIFDLFEKNEKFELRKFEAILKSRWMKPYYKVCRVGGGDYKNLELLGLLPEQPMFETSMILFLFFCFFIFFLFVIFSIIIKQITLSTVTVNLMKFVGEKNRKYWWNMTFRELMWNETFRSSMKL